MELPSKWLSFAIIVHGIFGSYVEILSLMLSRMTTPLIHFYNHSIILHYGIELDDSGILQINSIVGNIFLVGSIFSTIILVPKMDTWGRKNISVYATGLISSVASILTFVSKYAVSIELFAIGQLLVGVVQPFRNGVVKLYLAECSPDDIRGFSTQSVTVFSTFVTLFASLLTLEQVFGTDDRWQMIGLICFILCLIFFIFATIIPESPKFLSYEGAPKEKVVKTIKKFHGKNVDVEEILIDYSCEFHLTRTSHATFSELWSDLTLRESVFLVFIAALVHSFSSFQILFLNNILLKIRYGFTNSNALLFDSILGFCAIPFMGILPYLLEKIGRRKLFLLSIFMNILSSILMFLTEIIFELIGCGKITIILSIFYSVTNVTALCFGSTFMGIILIADLLPASAKAITTQAFILTTNILGIIVNFGFSLFEPIFGSFIHLPFILAQIYFLYVCYFQLPETKGKAVYQNYEQVRSRNNSVRHSLINDEIDDNENYGSIH